MMSLRLNRLSASVTAFTADNFFLGLYFQPIGIQNYLQQRVVHVTHLALFKPKGKFSVRSANVSPRHASIVEATEFWTDASGTVFANGAKFAIYAILRKIETRSTLMTLN